MRPVDFERLSHWRILPVLTEAEVEALTSLSRSALRRLRAAGRLAVVDCVGKVLYRTASVAALVGETSMPVPDSEEASTPDRRARRDADLLVRRIRR